MNNNRFASKFFLILLVLFLCVSGCAIEKKFVKSDVQTLESVKIAWQSSPVLLRETTASFGVGLSGAMFGAVGGAFSGIAAHAMMQKAGKATQEKYGLPDFSESVMIRLHERVPVEVDGWPNMVMEIKPVTDKSKNTMGNVLVVRVKVLKLSNRRGLTADVTGELSDKAQNVLWRKNFVYETGDFKRKCDLEQLEVDGGKLLREEYEFAANMIASIFIQDLRGELPTTYEVPDLSNAAAWNRR